MVVHVSDSEWVIGSAQTATASRRLPFGLGRMADERLAQLVAAGRERAFAVLYERYHQPLYRYCRSMLRNDQDAQDALQSTFASEEADNRARMALLMADLAQLPERQRAALLMRELNGLSHAEISVALATSVTAAKQAIFDARTALTEF